jgi:catechol 2,3-dioxygenase-like lactoylglutathione lyase family enzyme
MKRFHVHVAVADLAQSIRFYSTIFGHAPSVEKPDYAKWMLEDPRVNFAISRQGENRSGIDHLGFQVDSASDLSGMQAQLAAADANLVTEENTACCYARSDKYWVTDPTGIAWETFHTLGSVPVFGSDQRNTGEQVSADACCTPSTSATQAGEALTAIPVTGACCGPQTKVAAPAAKTCC